MRKYKAFFVAICISVTGNSLHAQFLRTGNVIYNDPATTKVGIGNQTPNMKLTVTAASQGDGIWVSGIGTTNVAMLNNVGPGGWNPLSQNGDNIILWKGTTAPDNADAGGLVIGPWSNYTRGMRITPDGNIGIGTSGPRGKLDIWGGSLHVTGTDQNGTFVAGSQGGTAFIGNDYLNNGIAIKPNGDIGIGTSGPRGKLDIWGGSLHVTGTDQNGTFVAGSQGGIAFVGNDLLNNGIAIMPNGNIGIGVTDTKGYKFAVNGDAVFTKIKVKAYPWPDYVFHINYRLRPLSEVEKYIQQYHHLPEMVAAEEVEKDGLDVANNQADLLRKVEELTLYLIEEHNKNKEQNKRLEEQAKLLEQQQREIDGLKKLLPQSK